MILNSFTPLTQANQSIRLASWDSVIFVVRAHHMLFKTNHDATAKKCYHAGTTARCRVANSAPRKLACDLESASLSSAVCTTPGPSV
ncbi:hypothetical protein A0H81_12393 [Grifola frondosa]|uniref:Uncharacterized protein n=1 Tax=Grifola frondosa TaxID=5627 RepID=A0A1C7LTT0_GRIFR|nr:hypothetical protein A0H81_12393 [Grifola frondosa]